MCAIIGFISKNPSDEAIHTLKMLFFESKIRGKHAYGFTTGDVTVKEHSLKTLLDAINRPNVLIGHCRYSTSGDYKNHDNNQPLRFKNEHMVFNGTIDMRTKAEMETDYNIVMNSDNDGEIMLQSSARQELLQGNITFAGLFMERKTVYALRNQHRPAYWAERHDSIYIGSTADIMKRCLLRPHELQPYELYQWTA